MTTPSLGLDIDLGGSLGDAGTALPDADGGSAVAALPPADPRDGLAYSVDKWSRLLFEKRTEHDGALKTQAEKVEGAIGDAGAARVATEMADAPEAARKLQEEQVRALGKTVGQSFGAEVFSRLYGDPEKREQAHDAAPWAPAAHEILDQLPEWEQLRAAVVGDPDFAALAAADVLGPVAEKLPELLKEIEQEQKDEQDGVEPAPKRGPSARDRMRAALRGGLAKSAQQTGERREALAGLAPGMELAPQTHEHPDATRMRLIEQVARDGSLREVLRRAGRLQRIAAQRKMERRSKDAREEVVDLERGNDVARVLPSQLAGLRHPSLRKLTLLRLAEGTALQYRLEGKEPQGRGPIVVLLDRSGSMSGDPNCWASAVGIACTGLAIREKRSVLVVEFNYHVAQVTYVDAKGEAFESTVGRNGKVQKLAGGLPAAAIRIAGANAGGGTNYDAALSVALDGLPTGLRDDRADLIFVTDGDCDISPETMKVLNAQKERGLRVYGLTVNGGSVSEAVRAICNNVVDIDKSRGDSNAIVDALPV